MVLCGSMVLTLVSEHTGLDISKLMMKSKSSGIGNIAGAECQPILQLGNRMGKDKESQKAI